MGLSSTFAKPYSAFSKKPSCLLLEHRFPFIYYLQQNRNGCEIIPGEKFQERKSELLERLKKSNELTEGLEEAIINVYGSRGEQAVEVIRNGGVREEEGRWFVQGREEEYEVVRAHCTCYDYVLNVVTGKAGVDMCYHGLAKIIVQLIRS